jgi:hypothetical protein
MGAGWTEFLLALAVGVTSMPLLALTCAALSLPKVPRVSPSEGE